MNKHLRALLIVGGLVVFGAVVALVIKRGQVSQEAAPESQKANIQINEGLPDFSSKTITDQEIKLSQYKGKIVVLNFWASWCGPCVEEMPSLIKLMQTFPNDVELVAVSGDSNLADIESFIKSFPELKTSPNIHVIFDQDKKLAQLYQIYRLPESFILSKEQKLVKKISGTIDWHTQDALDYMKLLIQGQNPSQMPENIQPDSQDDTQDLEPGDLPEVEE
jgi:thiol-disulfide isomerase/thioredoxin